MEEYMLPCLSKKYLGIECFGCGSQRAILLLFKGEFKAAFLMFPAVYTLVLLICFFALNFIDKSRSYHTAIVSTAIVTATTMVVSYFIKHFIYQF
jgi:heme/copper-type cytochrome/quinol oxidase subunit 4